MHISPFPLPLVSLSLLWWGAEEAEWKEEAGLGVIVPGGELTKVGHGYSPAPLFPPGDRVDLHTRWKSHRTLLFFYICAFILFLSLHISLSVSLSATLLLWPLASLLFPPLPLSLWG